MLLNLKPKFFIHFCIKFLLGKKYSISNLILLKKSFHVKSYFFVSHFLKTLALKICAVNVSKIKILYREQGHMQLLIIH